MIHVRNVLHKMIIILDIYYIIPLKYQMNFRDRYLKHITPHYQYI